MGGDAVSPDANEVADVACRHCGAMVRNVSQKSGASIHCLNCGKRYLLAVPEVSPVDAPRGREPAAAGYWMLRVAAAAVLPLLIVGWFAINWTPYSSIGDWLLWAVIYGLDLPMAVLCALAVANSMPRIEQHCIT